MIRVFIKKALAFQEEAHRILSAHEGSPSRVVYLKKSYEDLGKLSIQQDDLFRLALRCCEEGLYRAAHVMAWAAFMDFLGEKLSSDGFQKIKENYPNWNFCTLEEMREKVTEHQIIEAASKIGLYGKSQMKALLGLLNKRNECAHPSCFYPGLNETLGYMSELFQRINQLKVKAI